MNKQVINIIGEVVSVNGSTVKVLVENKKTHPKYNKSYTVTRHFFAHLAEGQKVEEGQTVTLIPSRKISKKKAWLIKK